ncbi:DJC14-like protein [Mya arenaria]|uniref:DJC14-like protein n=1 Tax=Mya arenaria TaxID=6604 RepID=A0ABY7FMC8_MYAAR|nr:DJC14-like protein [Mya arenaria]
MADKKPRGADGQYRSKDADFGVFQPMDNPTNQYPAYTAWTQFSGMPPSPNSPSTYGWDSFVTPPNSPSSDKLPPEANPNYFAELNKMMTAMGKNNAANFDNSNDTDKLANTPVAQSLLEALSSNPNGVCMMGAMGDPSLDGSGSMDYESFSQDGYEMYAEALKTLGDSAYQSYSPFGTTDVLNASPSSTPPPQEFESLGSQSSKPSYSEVAKSLKTNKSSGKESDDNDLGKRRSSENPTSRSFKGNKKFVPRPIRGRNNSVPDDMRPTVSPDSKYGLDDFGDEVKNKGEKGDLASGIDSIQITRRNSSSSLSSGTSGIEEIQLKPSNARSCNEELPQFEKISNKEKERDEKAKHGSKADTGKAFFDARRIFQTKDTNKRRSQSKSVDEEAGPQILNNGKPAYTAWSSTHKKSTNYINNNLRDSQKKTNQNSGREAKDQRVPPETVFSQTSSRQEKPSRSRTGSSKEASSASSTKPEMPLQTSFDHELIGDEAMQRLLACKGKDPYSILGLKASATDDDIKKYYRRQAVLVHPDKNQQAGAEEAFKILGHAFDLIGDQTKRLAYDRQLQEAKEAEAAMREFNDLLTKLQEKIHQASNMMRCDNCGGKHRRVFVERPWYSARFCDRCSMRHSAKEGDVWAETSMLGFLWHYYACMEGKVYDITEWVACKREFFKHMQANAHHVFYRIATEGNRGHHNRKNSGNTANSDADLEDFLSHLFHKAMNGEGGASGSPTSDPGAQTWNPPTSGPSQGWSANNNSAPAGKRHRKKKKKH